MGWQNIKRLIKAISDNDSTVQIDDIDEATAAAGVRVDAVLIKDKTIDAHAAGTLTVGADVATALTLGAADITTTNAGPLTATGLVTANGGITLGPAAPLKVDVGTLAASGSTIADSVSYPITKTFTQVTGADSTKCVALPVTAAGLVVIVKNAAAAALPVFPRAGSTINALTANSSYNMAAQTACLYVGYNSTLWYTVPLLAS
jgi:hypothetical protein